MNKEKFTKVGKSIKEYSAEAFLAGAIILTFATGFREVQIIKERGQDPTANHKLIDELNLTGGVVGVFSSLMSLSDRLSPKGKKKKK